MIEYLSRFKPWILAVTGIVGALAVQGALSLLVVQARLVWPAAAEGLLIGHLVVGAIVAWVIIGIFFEAILLGKRAGWFEAAMARIVDEYMDEFDEDEEEAEAGPIDLDELAVELGLMKESDRG